MIGSIELIARRHGRPLHSLFGTGSDSDCTIAPISKGIPGCMSAPMSAFAPSPAVCSECDLRADAPQVRACKRATCPLAQRQAA